VSVGALPRILRRPNDPEYPTFVELFFDLVFIFIFSSLSQSVLVHLSLRTVAETAVLLLAAWWVWVLTAWLTDLFNPQLPIIQGLVIVVMLGALVMGATIPEAFDGRGLAFVLAYFAIHLARDGVLIPGTRVNRYIQARSIRVFFWLCVTAVPWLAGAFVHGNARLALWGVAVAGDLISAAFGWPTPRLGRTDLSSRIFTGSHLSERHRQIVIIAFGELILTAGVGLATSRFEANQVILFVIVFANSVLLFQLYFQQIRWLLEPERTRWVEQVGPGTFTSYWHLIMVAGVVGTSASAKSVATRPFGHASLILAVLIMVSAALFLLGSSLFDRVVTGRIPWSRFGMMAVILAGIPVARLMPPLMILLTANVLLLITLLIEVVARRLRPDPVRVPHG
jgi:low temperature requirement protein LtrA